MRSPPAQYKHLMAALFFWSDSHDLEFIAEFQRRDRAASDTAGRKGKAQGVCEVVILS